MHVRFKTNRRVRFCGRSVNYIGILLSTLLTVQAEVHDGEGGGNPEEVEVRRAGAEEHHRAARCVDREEGEKQQEDTTAPLVQNLWCMSDHRFIVRRVRPGF